MRWVAILAVLIYRMLLRPLHRRVCLFPESCSAFAMRTFRTLGFDRGLPAVQARLRACRMPLGACFIVGADGRAQLVSATSGTEASVPPSALALLSHQAERVGSNVRAPAQRALEVQPGRHADGRRDR